MFRHLVHQPAHVGALDADALDGLRLAARAEQIDFRLPWAGNVNMGRFVIESVDHKSEAVGAVNDNHSLI